MPLSEPGGFFTETDINQIIGQSSGDDNTGDDVFMVGQGAGLLNTADDIIAIGTDAVINNDAPNLVVIGNRNYPLGINAAFDGGVLIGHDIMTLAPSNANIVDIVAIGSGINASDAGTFQRNSVYIGPSVLQGAGLSSCQSNVIVGAGAAEFANGNPVSNTVLVGRGAGATNGAASSTPNSCTYIGDGAGEVQVSGPNNTAVGRNAMGDGSISGNLNSAFGDQALEDLSSGINNSQFGAMGSGGVTSQDENCIFGVFTGSDFDTQGEGNTLIGAFVRNMGTTTAVGDIMIGRHAGQGGGFTAATPAFCLEGANTALGTPTRSVPFLYGDLSAGNLMLGQHFNAVSGNATDRALPNGTCVFSIQDADAGGGGGGVTTSNLTNVAQIYYDGSIGANVGELRCRFSNGVVATLAAS